MFFFDLQVVIFI